MKKKDLPKIIIIAIVILFVIPLLINLSFKIDSIRLLAAEWTAGDLLSFYGAVLGAVITLAQGRWRCQEGFSRACKRG